jgi:transposase
MNDIQPIITERVDDIPLLMTQMQQMALPALIDQYFPAHGNGQGLSPGWVCTIWLSSILSRGDHRLVHVQPWVASRLQTFRSLSGQAVDAMDLCDDRLERLLRHLSDDIQWARFEEALNQQTIRVYDLSSQRVHLDSTTASAYTTVSDAGLLQFGHSKDHRPDLPQVKVMQAVLDPLGMPLATDVVSGEKADDPLYIPCIQRVQQSLGRCGLLFVGDCQMASRETRGFIASRGDFYLCPLPQVQLADGELEEALEAIETEQQALIGIFRPSAGKAPELIAEGIERQRAMEVEIAGKAQQWTERRLVVRSQRHAKAAEQALRARVAQAQAEVEALNLRGRGRKRYEEIDDLRQAVMQIVQRHQVEDCLWRRYDQSITRHPKRAYRGQAAGFREDRQALVAVHVDEEALASAIHRLGWRISSTNQPAEQLALDQAILAYRQEYQVERSLGRLKGRPLSLRPRYVQRDDHATGLIRLLSIALRVLTLLEFVVRRQLATAGTTLSGLYAGNPKRETTRPTAERLLEAFQGVTWTIIVGTQQSHSHLTALSPLQKRILDLLGVSEQAYTRLSDISLEPP